MVGRQTVLDQDIFEQMTSISDGIYQYSFTITKVEKITISVLLYTQGGVFAEYSDNIKFRGDNNANRTEILTNLNYSWGTGAVSPTGKADFLSARFYFLLKSPTNGTVNFQLNVDDYGYFCIGKKNVD